VHISLGTADDQSAGGKLLSSLRPYQERDISAGFDESRTEVASDRSSSNN